MIKVRHTSLRPASRRGPRWLAAAVLLFNGGMVTGEEVPDALDEDFPDVRCSAEQTGGFHDYPTPGEDYEPALFHPQSFTLEVNPVFMMNLAPAEANVDLYLTMTRELRAPGEETVTDTTELECRRVRGADGSFGFSCVNVPPSEMLLINARTLRFTRTAVGGWTFSGATESDSGDSIFVEYGQCVRLESPGAGHPD